MHSVYCLYQSETKYLTFHPLSGSIFSYCHYLQGYVSAVTADCGALNVSCLKLESQQDVPPSGFC